MGYWLKIFKTGAVIKTPKLVIEKITREINQTSRKTIFEFGAGKGEITSQVLKNVDSNLDKYYAFELDTELGDKLKNKQLNINVIIQNAFQFSNYIPQGTKADYIICSIPLSFYSLTRVKTFLKCLKGSTHDTGKVLIVFNAIWLTFIFKAVFKTGKIYCFSTFPIYFLFVYSAERSR